MNFFRRIDWILLFSALLLSAIGTLMIYSTSIEASGIDYSFMSRQMSYLFFGLIIFFIVARLDYRLVTQFSFLLYGLVLVLLVLTFVFGDQTRGSVRWIDLKIITIQASEIAKPVIILTLAHFFSKYPSVYLKNVLVSFILVAVPAFLVFLQPDLGNTFILLSLWFILVFAAGMRLSHIFFAATSFLLVIPIVWNFLKGYQRDRIFSFLNPEKDPLGSGYNLVQAIIAVGSGGLFGRGFGRGTQSHLNFLPEQKTDFIFATSAEELGFLGVGIILVSLGVLVYRVLKIANQTKDHEGSLVALGVASLIVVHTFINIGMNLGIFPVTGITLPLLSFGGSSLISMLVSLGLVTSISVHKEKPK